MESADVSVFHLCLCRCLCLCFCLSLLAANELCGVKWATTTNKFHMRHKLQSMRDFDFPNEAISCYPFSPVPSPLPPSSHSFSASPSVVNRHQRTREPRQRDRLYDWHFCRECCLREGRGGGTLWLATVAQICTKTTSTGASSFQFSAIARNLFI